MSSLDVTARIQARVGADAAQPELNRADPTLVVPAGSIRSLCQWLKDDTEMAFDHLMCLSGVDWPDRIEVVYHLFSHQHRHRIVLKVRLSREHPSIDSVSNVWGLPTGMSARRTISSVSVSRVIRICGGFCYRMIGKDIR